MFYSQLLLSRKGPLGVIWIAAHCHRKLKKHQVYETDVSSSVDKILLDEVPVVTYRILAHLLLGVVRIYSKKVEYLFRDCRSVLAKLGDFSSGKRVKGGIETLRAPRHYISRPKRFELDAFDLEILDDHFVSGCNVMPSEETLLADMSKNDDIDLGSTSKYQYEVDVSCSEAHPADYTPVRDVLSPGFTSKDLEVSLSPPRVLEKFRTRGTLSGAEFVLEEWLEPMTFDEELQTDREQMKHPEPVNSGGSPDINKLQQMDVEKTTEPEMSSLENKKQRTAEKHPITIGIDVTPESKLIGGMSSPDYIAVHTPAAKDRRRIMKKRKCLLDESIVFPNKVVKHWIDDSSDLVSRRRKAPHTAFLAWKAQKITSLPQSLLDPLIPCSACDVGSLVGKNTLKTIAEPLEIPVDQPTVEDNVESAVIHRSREQSPIAPGTPVTRSVSLRLLEARELAKSPMEPASSIESSEEGPLLVNDLELDTSLMDEELNSCQEDKQQNDKCSSRTRIVARYLHWKFLNQKKRNGLEFLNVSQVLKGKTRKEGARFFYEILVLKSEGHIDVKQEGPGEILVVETPTLKQIFEV